MNQADCWLTTYTGKKFYPLNPKIEDIDILDIAHHLSLICRFTGACRIHYSVAEHSVRGIPLVPKDQRLAFLLHDSPEAYMADLGRGVKLAFPDYKVYENKLLSCILQKFGVTNYDYYAIKKVDNILLNTEGRDLLPNTNGWGFPGAPLSYTTIEPWSNIKAEEVFLYEFERLSYDSN